MVDIHGREIKVGDLIRVPHFRTRRKRVVYMHKLVVSVDKDFNIVRDGDYLYAVDVADIARKLDLQKAFKCRLESCGECEIIDCQSNLNDLWWERPKMKVGGEA